MGRSSSTSSSESGGRGAAPFPLANAWRGFLLGGALIAAFELLVAAIPEDAGEAPPYCRAGLAIKAAEAERPGDYDVLFFGECYAYDGIDPRIVERWTGLTAFNFCVNRGHLWLSSYVLCERYLEHAARPPRVVVLEVAPGAVALPPFDVGPLFEANVLPLLGASLDVFRAADRRGRLAILEWLASPPSLRKQSFLKRPDWPLALLTHDPAPFRGAMERWRADRGYYDKERDPPGTPVTRSTTLPQAERAYRIHARNAGFITDTIALAAEHGVPVVLFTPAVCEELGRAWELHGVKAKHRAWLAGVRARHPNVIAVIDLMDEVVPDADVPDAYHPNRAGAVALSRRIGARLREILAGPAVVRHS